MLPRPHAKWEPARAKSIVSISNTGLRFLIHSARVNDAAIPFQSTLLIAAASIINDLLIVLRLSLMKRRPVVKARFDFDTKTTGTNSKRFTYRRALYAQIFRIQTFLVHGIRCIKRYKNSHRSSDVTRLKLGNVNNKHSV